MADPYKFSFDVAAFLEEQEAVDTSVAPKEGVMKKPEAPVEVAPMSNTDRLKKRFADTVNGFYSSTQDIRDAYNKAQETNPLFGRKNALDQWEGALLPFPSPVTVDSLAPMLDTAAPDQPETPIIYEKAATVTNGRDSAVNRRASSGLMSPSVQDTVSEVDTTTAAAPVGEANAATYSVASGDTLSKIAKANNTTVAELTAANPDIKDINKIDVGQEIKLPTVTAEEAEVVTTAADTTEETTTSSDFYLKIGEKAETDHGSVPVATKDAKEKNVPVAERSKDVGFGHKVKASENTSGMIHGIKFKNDDGTYIALTKEQKVTILNEDMKAESSLARTSGWDAKLKKIGTSWDDLDSAYRNALTSLAYNTGGVTAGKSWTNVLTAAKDKNVTSFALGLRRTDADKNTAGMDNRVVKELYFAGLIDSIADVATQLPLADKRSGVPLK